MTHPSQASEHVDEAEIDLEDPTSVELARLAALSTLEGRSSPEDQADLPSGLLTNPIGGTNRFSAGTNAVLSPAR